MKERLHVAVGIGDPDAGPGQTEAIFESRDPSGRLVIPVEGLIKALHDSSTDWRKKSLLIQAEQTSESDKFNTLFAADNRLELSRQRSMISVDGHWIDDMTAQEFGLLDFLMWNVDKVNQRSDIYETVWGHAFRLGDRTVDVYVNKLRRKIGSVSEELADREHGAIRSRFGIGYYAVSSLKNSA